MPSLSKTHPLSRITWWWLATAGTWCVSVLISPSLWWLLFCAVLQHQSASSRWKIDVIKLQERLPKKIAFPKRIKILNLSIPQCLVLQLMYCEVGCSHYILASQVRVGLKSIYNVWQYLKMTGAKHSFPPIIQP